MLSRMAASVLCNMLFCGIYPFFWQGASENRCNLNVKTPFITAILFDNSGIWDSYPAGKVE